MADPIMIDTDTMIRISRSHGATYLALFGSTARGPAKSGSDVDLLVDFDTPKSLLDLVRIERELADSTGQKVDLLTEGSISPHMRNRMAEDLQVLYDGRA